jgi:hypothetical protein
VEVHQFPEYLILQRKDDPLLYVYKEYRVPKFIGNSEVLPAEFLTSHLESRRAMGG